MNLFIQILYTLAVLAFSGAILPVIYLPVQLQEVVEYSFSFQAFSWVSDIILNGRMYADFIPLILITCAGYFILLAVSMWKERALS